MKLLVNSLYTICFVALFSGVAAQSVWEILPVPNTGTFGRYDDICFVNDSVGYAIGSVKQSGQPPRSFVYKTVDSGYTWAAVDSFAYYLRTIRFVNEQLGFLGTLDSVSLLMTTNGGSGWSSIVDTMPVKPKAICGISVADSSYIYAVGAWSGTPCVVKSANGGKNWQYINMTAHCTALVDVWFTDSLTGFVAGVAKPQTKGGVILYTSNGGATWQKVFESNAGSKEYVWKLQRLDSLRWYASVEATAPAASTRIIVSKNGGFAWDTIVVVPFKTDIQMVGFLDTLHGFAGGYYPQLFETKDGGQTWDSLVLDNNYNRFWRVSDKRAFLTGKGIYMYRDTTSVPDDTTGVITGLPALRPYDDEIKLFPNPVGNKLNIELELVLNTYVLLSIITAEGRIEKMVYDGPLSGGKHPLAISVADLPKGMHYVQLHTHLGIRTKPFIITR